MGGSYVLPAARNAPTVASRSFATLPTKPGQRSKFTRAPSPSHNDKHNAGIPPASLRRSIAAIDQFDYSAVVVERGAAAEIGDGGEDVVHRHTLPCHRFQAVAVEHVSAGVFSFSHAVRD